MLQDYNAALHDSMSFFSEDSIMADMKEALEMMKDMALERIRMLKDGITLHDDFKRAYYLQEYEAKLSEINKLIRRLKFRVIRFR
ncbi:hypothetical protein Gura_0860 [Geotalea uraniireducens Rf4]|uniref:Uncharacterized protein n=2 Tax=Geotalea uraniireducens TaxID=351604 RepID=A5GBI9_GEOUR|nr:hypothetical protein Gura_0860 [Geotalea uraniireducens Rf4]